MKRIRRTVRDEKRVANAEALLAGVLPEMGRLLWRKKARNIVGLDLRKIVFYTDFVVVASGSSDRHVKGLHKELLKYAKEAGLPAPKCEGEDLGRWVLVDFGDIVVHLFHEPLRELYDLDRLWAEAPRIPLVTEKTPLEVKPAEDEPDPWPDD